MTGTFQLTLDTTAPQIAWGAVLDPVASEEMTVYYTVTEPGVISAVVRLVDGRELPMQVYADRLVITLPDDAPESDATVHVVLRDSVWNTATADLPVHVTGPTGAPPAYVPPVGLPSPPERVPARVIRFDASAARASSAYEQTAVLSSTTTARPRSRYILPIPRTRRIFSAVTASDNFTVRPEVSTRSEGKPSSAYTIRRQPDGPDTEAALAALGIL
jgi:hypothetical protein